MNERIKNIFQNKKLTITITLIILLLIIGGTYALLSGVNISNGRYGYTTACFDIDYDQGDDITGNLIPSSTPTGGLNGYVKIGFEEQCETEGIGNLYLTASSTDSNSVLTQVVAPHCENTTTLQTLTDYKTKELCNAQKDAIWVTDASALKYAVYKNEETIPVSVGYINKLDEKINIYSSFEVNKTNEYSIYIWLDGNISDNTYLNKPFSGIISATVEQKPKNIIEPKLDEGMIPVIISDDGTVTTISESDKNWYDYSKQKWANVVLVTEETRNGYLNISNKKVDPEDILAYYVWIPRYKYKIWTTETSAKGSEQPIEIEFESMDTPMNMGTEVGEYRTHPAFWWDDNNDGKVTQNEMLPGIWVGKFETTGTSTVPTVKPNSASLTSQTISAQFNTSLLFAGGSMDTSTGKVTFGDNTYGLTEITDSHMMKNSEWGAVAYLSHSQYGINDEVRINNYYNSATLTGCGALTENEAIATTCGIPYGTPSPETNTYPQSTTGNISGVFDMSGGAWDAVMANYNKTAGSSGFSVYPESKYYDNYTTADISTACNGEICYGHALSETNNWGGDWNTFLTTSSTWLYRGARYVDNTTTGIFAYAINTGLSDSSHGHRSVLIPQMNYTVNFDANGGSLVDISYTTVGEYEFVVPHEGNYQIELWGASGNGCGTSSCAGGLGGYTSGNIYLNDNELLYIYVGGSDGYNGGGSGHSTNPGYSGGGGTDVRYNDNTLHSRIIVAAGGGGGQSYYSSFSGGNAGGLSGYSGSKTGSNGSTSSGANQIGTGSGSGGTPGFGIAGTGNGTGGGGGGGYYGAYAGPHGSGTVGSGGGGSSFISGHTGCVAIESFSSTSARKGTNSASCTTGTSDNLCSVHYSEMVFNDTIMIDGAGYGWTNVKGSLQQMPNPNGGYYASGVGHSGNGFARIRQSSEKDIAYEGKYGKLPMPTREGYTFLGWYTAPEGGVRITENTVVNSKGNRTLYAHWSVNEVNISYSVNGGTITSSTTSTDGNTIYNWTITDDDMINLNGQLYTSNISGSHTINLPNYNDNNFMNMSRDGYGVPVGEEWICLSGCKKDNLTFDQEQEYSIVDFCSNDSSECRVVLGVNWLRKYIISYNLNGGNGELLGQEKLHGIPINLRNDIPAKEGYVLLGWNTDFAATSPIYRSGEEYTLNDNKVLYAIWKKFEPLNSYKCSNTSVGSEPYDLVYTGQCTMVNEEDGNWNLKLLTDGKLTMVGSTYIDAFLLGGGGGGGNSRDPGNQNPRNHDGHPGGGGYYDNLYSYGLSGNIEYEITIGGGGAAAYNGYAGGSTTAFGITVKGGEGGGNGWGSYAAGCNTTTNGFDVEGTTYSGAGTLGTAGTSNRGNGGGGGVAVVYQSNAGKNGGSGIVIIRNARNVIMGESTVIPEFTYTGAYAIVNDNDDIIAVSRDNWRIKFLTSGILVFNNLRSAENGIDAFLLGGGGGGGTSRDPGNENPRNHDGHPGGGGYFDNIYGISVSKNTEYEIVVGAGGAAAYDGLPGGSTTAFGMTVNGGDGGGNGWGGSASGNFTTTNGFGIDGSIFSGGGTLNVAGTNNRGNGGGGGYAYTGGNADGKNGGSGIVIIRNKR